MKLLFVALAIAVFPYVSFGQEKPSEDPLKLFIEEPSLNLKNGSKLTKHVIIPKEKIHEEDAVSVVDIKSEFWDNAVYNPYRNTLVEFPLQIIFDDSTYASPVSHKKYITSRFGWRRGRPHNAIDIDLVTGDSVVSMLDGVVRFARYSRGHGKTVVVRHFNGLETTYAHLSHIAVKTNDTLSKGQYLGKGGNTGRSTGSHLHLSVTYMGEFVHPEYLFNFDETNTIRSSELWVTRKWTRASYHNSRRSSKLALYTSREEALTSLEKQNKVYVVRKGDTLYGISRRNNTSIASICRTNKIKKSSPLKIGQKLILEP